MDADEQNGDLLFELVVAGMTRASRICVAFHNGASPNPDIPSTLPPAML
jgi:hypothetical protein